jgi:hypothetical protein
VAYEQHLVRALFGDKPLSLVQDRERSVIVRITEAFVDLNIGWSTREAGLVKRRRDEVDIRQQRQKLCGVGSFMCYDDGVVFGVVANKDWIMEMN